MLAFFKVNSIIRWSSLRFYINISQFELLKYVCTLALKSIIYCSEHVDIFWSTSNILATWKIEICFYFSNNIESKYIVSGNAFVFEFESTFRENYFISHRNIDHFELFKYVFVFCHTQLALLFYLFYMVLRISKYLAN